MFGISTTTRNNEKAVKKNAKGAESEKDTNNTRSNEIGAKKNEIGGSRVEMRIYQRMSSVGQLRRMYSMGDIA
jgi:hypothetical protein